MFKMLESFLNPQKGYQAGQEELNKYYQQGQNYLQPYAQQGHEAYGHLNNAMQNLLSPSSLLDQFMNNYKESDAARFAKQRAMNSGLSAAQSMGLGGSSSALQGLQSQASEIGAMDEQRYLDRMINQYLQGAGLAQGIYGQGANAGSAMGQNAMNMGQNASQLAYGKQNAPGELFGSLLGTAAGLGTGYMGMQGMNNLAKAWSTSGGRM